jgi:hypothetical protein
MVKWSAKLGLGQPRHFQRFQAEPTTDVADADGYAREPAAGSAVQCSAVQCSAVQCSAVHCGVTACSASWCACSWEWRVIDSEDRAAELWKAAAGFHLMKVKLTSLLKRCNRRLVHTLPHQ